MPAKKAKSAKAVESEPLKEPVLNVIRFERFKEVVEKALEEALKTLSVEKLESSYPSIAKTAIGGKYLEASQQQISDFWSSESKKEFQLIYEERDLETKLTELDKLIYEAEVARYTKEDGAKIFPDQLTPKDLINGKLAVAKRQKIEEYEERLRQLKSENDQAVTTLGQLLKESQQSIGDVEKFMAAHFSGIEDESQSYEEVNQNIKELLAHLSRDMKCG